MRVIETHPDRKADIRGIDNHQIYAIPLVSAGGVTATKTCEVIAIMNEHSHHGKDKTIHSSPKIEHYKNIADKLTPWKNVKLLCPFEGHYPTYHYVLHR